MPNSKYLRALLLETVTDRNLYISLHAADPGEGGAGEILGAGYTRQNIIPSTITEGVASNRDVLSFENLPETVATHFGVWDAQQRGNFLMGGPLLEAKKILAGQGVQWREGELILRIG